MGSELERKPDARILRPMSDYGARGNAPCRAIVQIRSCGFEYSSDDLLGNDTEALPLTLSFVRLRHAPNNGDGFILNVGQIIREIGNVVHG